MRMLRKASRGGKGGKMANNWKVIKSNREELVCKLLLEGLSPTGQQGLSQDGAQVSAGPGEAVISCP